MDKRNAPRVTLCRLGVAKRDKGCLVRGCGNRTKRWLIELVDCDGYISLLSHFDP